MALDALDAELDSLPGTISVWVAPAGSPVAAYERLADAAHYAASTMKAAVLAALYRADAAGQLDLDAEVPVVNDFASAKPGAPRFANAQDYDQDDDVWDRLGGTATLRWLARHMIVRSSNFATNLVLGHVGVPAVHEVLRIIGATNMTVNRGIEDADAREAGIDNLITARDLGALMGAIAVGSSLAPRDVCDAMLEVLFAQEHREDLAAGLPPGTRIAHKNGWIEGVRHGAGVVFPDDAPPYAIVVATTTPLADSEDGDDACTLIARVAAASWEDRHQIGQLLP
ncbi:MAG TPA: serine hydrolase [Micromonosporaceae bacterium]